MQGGPLDLGPRSPVILLCFINFCAYYYNIHLLYAEKVAIIGAKLIICAYIINFSGGEITCGNNKKLESGELF